MGNDVADINNDGLLDIIAVDMLPETNYRKKTMMAANNYTNYINNSSYQYTFQFVRNVLQLNNGKSPETGSPRFSDIAMMAGIEATDWSWAPMIADFDADGFRDIIITNGFPKDITDKDFTDYQSEYSAFIDKKEILAKVPEVKLKNYAYRNDGNLGFEDVTSDWGISTPSFSNGAAYGDLDNDGDLDYVVNNINDIAHIYQNKTNHNSENHYLQIALIGKKPNIEATGTIINYKTANLHSAIEFNTSRGYLSAVSSTIYMGLGKDSLVDLEIIWPDHTITKMAATRSNQKITIDQTKQTASPYVFSTANTGQTIFSIDRFIPQDTITQQDYIDFNSDPLLLKKLSNHGPGIAVADVNGDGLDDYYVAGPRDRNGKLYIQGKNGFTVTALTGINAAKEELAPIFADVDGDGDPDLFIGCGSNEYNENDPKLKDELWINEGGKFTKSIDLDIPNIQTSCVKSADFDGDGDLDFFIGGKSITYKYPKPEESFLLVNESANGEVKFKKLSEPFQDHKVMVSDALWTDYNMDGNLDLIVIGDFAGIHFYKNTGKELAFDTNDALNNIKGWWYSINGGDLDNDGDIDYVLGNFGLNSLIKVKQERPIKIYSKDFDGNGSYDFIPTVFIKEDNGNYLEAPYHVKGDLTKELVGFKKKFVYYSSIAKAPIDTIISGAFRKDAYVVEANELRSIVLLNNGKGQFEVKYLPKRSQISPIIGTIIEDFDGDGNPDILAVGNDYGAELTMGRLDASFGSLLKGDGKGDFTVVPMNQSGIDLKCEPRSLAKIYNGKGLTFIMTNYNGPIKGIKTQVQTAVIKTLPTDIIVKFINAKGAVISSKECYIGNGYQSQSTSYMTVPSQAVKAEVKNSKGETRTIEISQKES